MADDKGPGGVLEQARASAGELGAGAYSFLLCLASIALVGFIGVARKEPWVFPSLGPTVMLFFESPRQPTASARNAVVGHLGGILVGAACLYGFALDDHVPAMSEGLTARRVLAAALSVAGTALLLRLLHTPHPPAGATTLIISLGVVRTPTHMVTMAVAVLVVTVFAVAVNNLLGVRHPLVPVKPPSAA